MGDRRAAPSGAALNLVLERDYDPCDDGPAVIVVRIGGGIDTGFYGTNILVGAPNGEPTGADIDTARPAFVGVRGSSVFFRIGYIRSDTKPADVAAIGDAGIAFLGILACALPPTAGTEFVVALEGS